VVGGDLADPVWSTGSPMFFPQGTTPFQGLWGMAVTAVQNGDKRIGLVTCQETALCRQVDQLINGQGWAGLAGGTLAYAATASIAAPEYTAICQNAVNAGVEGLLVVADAATLIRMARSCGNTGMRFYSASLAIQNVLATDNPGPLEGLVGIQQIFPFPVTDFPGAKEFRQAMATYAPNAPIDAGSAQGWVAGKLFERAARNVGTNPTTAEILEGLWTVSNENLGGLTVPLTFVRGKGAPEPTCWFVLEVRGKDWAAPKGAEPICGRHP
jgi:branched-chain amino acid transport system substrate-binding protein